MEAQTRRFLHCGGRVQRVPTGISSRENSDVPARPYRPMFPRPARPRTPLDDVVAALEQRKLEQRLQRKSRSRARVARKPRRKIIYDDFGEPVREIWV